VCLIVYGQLLVAIKILFGVVGLLLHTTGPAVYISFVLSATVHCIMFLVQKLKYRFIQEYGVSTQW